MSALMLLIQQYDYEQNKADHNISDV